jgi:hypothetical protein
LNFNIRNRMKASDIWLLAGHINIDSLSNLDVVLSLVDKKGNPSAVKLSVRVTQDSTSAVAADAIQQAQMSAQQLSQPLVSTMSDAFADISDTMSNQQNLITSFNALMKRLEPLVKIGDEVAKVCSSVSSPLLDDRN